MSDDRSSSEASIREEFNRMRGRLCGLIESWGLPDKQERGAINTLKSLSYDAEKTVTELVAEPHQQTVVARN